MSNETLNVTGKTRELVDRWIAANKSVRSCKSELTRAEIELLNATNELGKWLVPSDPHPDKLDVQWFNIWFGSGILRARRPCASTASYAVEWFKEPDGKDRHEYGL